MNNYNEELYSEMCQDNGIEYDNDEVEEELIKDLEDKLF